MFEEAATRYSPRRVHRSSSSPTDSKQQTNNFDEHQSEKDETFRATTSGPNSWGPHVAGHGALGLRPWSEDGGGLKFLPESRRSGQMTVWSGARTGATFANRLNPRAAQRLSLADSRPAAFGR